MVGLFFLLCKSIDLSKSVYGAPIMLPHVFNIYSLNVSFFETSYVTLAGNIHLCVTLITPALRTGLDLATKFVCLHYVISLGGRIKCLYNAFVKRDESLHESFLNSHSPVRREQELHES